MTSYKIFTKSENFFWSKSVMVNGSIIAILILLIIKPAIIGDTKDDFFEKLLFWLMVGFFLYGIIYPFRRAQLRGVLKGDLVFEMESIIVENRIISLDDIRLIKFEIDDYEDRVKTIDSFYFEFFSAGVDNKIIIILNTGEVVVRQFKLINERGMLKALDQINNYYSKKKMIKRDYDHVIG